MILIAQGAGAAAYEDIFQYGRALATDTLPEPGAPSGPGPLAHRQRRSLGQAPLAVRRRRITWSGGGRGAGPSGWRRSLSLAYLAVRPRTTSARRLVAAWTVAAGLQVVLPGLYWQHYYLLPTPGIALVVAAALATALGARRSRRPIGPAGIRQTRSWRQAVAALLLILPRIAATVVIQVRDYLLVPPQELTVRYKGGGQWVVLRSLGPRAGRRKSVWTDPRLYVWGWQSPLHFYGKLDGVTRHFFVDNLLRDQAERDHPLIKPRIDEIMRDLRDRPPALIFVGYAPFPALRALPRGAIPALGAGAREERAGALGSSRQLRRDSRTSPAGSLERLRTTTAAAAVSSSIASS